MMITTVVSLLTTRVPGQYCACYVVQIWPFFSEREGRKAGRKEGETDLGAATMPGQPKRLEEGYMTNHLLTLPARPPPLSVHMQPFLAIRSSDKEGQTTWGMRSKALEALVARTPHPPASTKGSPQFL